MSETAKALKKALEGLHAIEHDLELANALTPSDHRLNDAEIVLHECIGRVERITSGEREPTCSGVLVHSEYERCERCDR